MHINLSKVIRYHRIKSGLTQIELADMELKSPLMERFKKENPDENG